MAGEAEVERMVVRLLGDASNYEQSLKRSAKATQTFSRRAVKQLNRVSLAMRNLGRNLSFRVTAPLTILGIAAIKVGADFEKGFTGVKKTVDATEEEFAVLRKEFKSLALEIPVAVEDLLKIGEAAGQLGIRTESILKFTETMAALSVAAADLTPEDAATQLARFINITKLGQDKIENLASSIVALGNDTATTEGQILSMATRIAGAGATMGMSDAEIVGFAASLSAVGMTAEAGGTSFSKLLLEIKMAIALGTKELKLFAKVSGNSVEKFRTKFKKDASGTVIEFLQGLKDLEGEAKVIALKDLGLIDSRMIRMLLAASRGVDIFTGNLNLSTKAFEENAALAEEAAKAYKTFWSQLTLLKNQMKDLLEKVFIQMKPALLGIIDSVKSLVKWFGDLSPGTIRLAVIIGVISAIVGPALLMMANVLGLMGFAIAGVTLAITGLGVVLTFLLSPFGLMLIAVIAATVAIVALALATVHFTGLGKKALEGYMKIWDMLVDHVEKAMKGIEDALVGDDLKLAFKIAWTQMELSFIQSLRSMLIAFRKFTGAIPWIDFTSGTLNDLTNSAKALESVLSLLTDVAATKAGKVWADRALAWVAQIPGVEGPGGPGGPSGKDLPGPLRDKPKLGTALTPRPAAQVGTAEAQSRIMAFRAGAGPASENKRTADNTDKMVVLLEEIKERSPFPGGTLQQSVAQLKRM